MKALEVLRERVRACKACPILHEASLHPTPSSGTNSPIVFVGRNPGITERDQGYPFVGKTKSDMDAMISVLGYDRDTVYITNWVKCYTSIPKPDRPPTQEEGKFCAGLHLEEELKLIQPKLVIPLGKDPFVYLMSGRVSTCTGYTGTPYINPDRPSIVLFPLFHPAMLLRNPAHYREKMEADFGNLFMYCLKHKLLGPKLNSAVINQ